MCHVRIDRAFQHFRCCFLNKWSNIAITQGFRKINVMSDARALYLHSVCISSCFSFLKSTPHTIFFCCSTIHQLFLSNKQVLTCRSGSVVMLSLIYSEMLKMLRIYGFLDFDAEIYFPFDLNSLPRGYEKQKSKISDEPHIMTSKLLLVKVG